MDKVPESCTRDASEYTTKLQLPKYDKKLDVFEGCYKQETRRTQLSQSFKTAMRTCIFRTALNRRELVEFRGMHQISDVKNRSLAALPRPVTTNCKTSKA